MIVAVAVGFYWAERVWNDPRRWLVGRWEGHEIRERGGNLPPRMERRTLVFEANGGCAMVSHTGRREDGEWRAITSGDDGSTITLLISVTSGSGEPLEQAATVVFEDRNTCRVLPEGLEKTLVLRRQPD